MHDPVICHVAHSLNVGGAEVLMARLARRLRDRFNFVFACLDELGTLGEELRAEGFPVQVIGRQPGLDWRCAVRLSKFLRAQYVDLIHAHNYTPFSYALMARQIYRRPPVIFTEHGRHRPDFRRPKRVLFNRLLLRNRDRVVGVGEAVRDALIKYECLAPHRVGVIYNGIDLGKFENRRSERATIRQQLGLGADDFMLVQVARLDVLKDHATAIRTMARVVQQHPSVRLFLVGEGPYRESIEKQIVEFGLRNRVTLLGLRSDVTQILSAADLFLLTSISEGVPLTIMEAMAAGLAVVSTNVGGVAEVVAENETGLLVPPGGDLALASAILRLTKDLELREKMAANGRARANVLFSELRMTDEYCDMYLEMQADPKRSAVSTKLLQAESIAH